MEANLTVDSDGLDPDFGSDEKLFHYTSSAGLYGILESGCLWATHFKYLNDSNEFFAARKSLVTFVELEIRKKIAALKVTGAISLKKDVILKDLSLKEANNIVDSLYVATLKGSDPFVFSSYVSDPSSKAFRNGELLHWATYGRDGGYAVELNPHKLAKLMGATDNMLSRKAIYVKDEVPIALKSDYELIGKMAQEMIEGLLSETLAGLDLNPSAKAFMRVSGVIKDAFFENECEARLVALRLKSPYAGYEIPNVYIRHQNSRPIPYIKLFENKLCGEGSPIEAIIIGPHPEREKRRDALALFLESRGLKNIAVFQSDVPYLG